MGSKNTRLAAFASNVNATGDLASAGGGVQIYNVISELPMIGNTAGDLAYVDSDSRLYIFSGEGWYNISISDSAL